MGLFDWLSATAERSNIEYARSFLQTLRRKALAEPALLQSLAQWAETDGGDVLSEAWAATHGLPKEQARAIPGEAANRLQETGQRIAKAFGGGDGLASGSGLSMQLTGVTFS